ncbi:MAG: hypothetical protein CMH55_03190 [Myxococcales bacterium]|nr:hypothetical protein [Myxococcales bacterium]
MLDFVPEVNISPDVKNKVKVLSQFIEFSESSRRYFLVIEVEALTPDLVPQCLEAFGFTGNKTLSVTTTATVGGGAERLSESDRQLLESQFPNFPPNLKRQVILFFDVGSIVAKHTETYYIVDSNKCFKTK